MDYTKHPLVRETADLAVRADEAGLHGLALALLLVVRGAKLERRVVRCVVNTGALLLDTVECAVGERRSGVDRRQP